MRRGRVLIFLALILLLGVVVVGVLMSGALPALMRGGGSTSATPGPNSVNTGPTAVPDEIEVVVLAQPVALGAVIDESMLQTIPYPRKSLAEGLFMTDMAQVVGRRARYDLQPGVILNKGYLAEKAEDVSKPASDATFLIPRGMVAVSIPIGRLSSISYAPRRGDHVNVIVTLKFVDLDESYQTVLPNYTASVIGPGPAVLLGMGKGDKESSLLTISEQLRTLSAQIISGGSPAAKGRAEQDTQLEQTLYVVPSEAQRPRLVSQTLIQNVMVLQIGEFPETDVKEEEKPKASDGTPTPTPLPTATPQPGSTPVPAAGKPEVITLIVSPQDAVTLNYLIYSGAELTLALRPAGDDTLVQTEAVTLSFLTSQYRINLPTRLNYGMDPRADEVIVIDTPAQPTPER